MASATAERFPALDMLRGLAAVTVAMWHFGWPVANPVPRAYLAVDLFFALSGFVIAHAYADRLAAGMSPARFALLRLIRLYPLYLLGSLGGLAVFAIYPNDLMLPWTPVAISALLMLPMPRMLGYHGLALYPLDFPAWSLLWELVVNVLFGLIVRRLTPWLLVVAIAVGLVLVAGTIRSFGSINAGGEWDAAQFGLWRALFAFFAGVGLYRLRRRFRPPLRVPAWLLGLIYLLAVARPVHVRFDNSYDLALVVVVLPLLVLFGADAHMSAAGRRFGLWLGSISYGVYVLQIPVLGAASFVPLDGWYPWGLLLYLALTIAAAWAASRWFDEPVRAWLTRRAGLAGPRTPAAETAP